MGRWKAVIAVFLACFLIVGVQSAFAKESVNDPYYAEATQAPEVGHEALVGEGEDGHAAEATEEGAEHAEAGEHGAEHGGEHGKKGLPQFDPSSFSSQVFWLAISFAIMYAFFSKVTLPQIAKVQHKRRAHIEHDIATAQKMRENAEEARIRFETAVAKAQSEASALFKRNEVETVAMFAAAVDEFKAQAQKRVQDVEAEISAAKKEAMENIHNIAAEIASMAAKKIVGVSADIGEAKSVVRNINKKAA